jgi:hypothetical protein
MNYSSGFDRAKMSALLPIEGLNTEKWADCVKIFYALMFLDEKYLSEVSMFSITPSSSPFIECDKKLSFADFREQFEKSGKIGLTCTVATDESDEHRIMFNLLGNVGPFKNMYSNIGIKEKIIVNIYDKEGEEAFDEISDNLQKVIKEFKEKGIYNG